MDKIGSEDDSNSAENNHQLNDEKGQKIPARTITILNFIRNLGTSS